MVTFDTCALLAPASCSVDLLNAAVWNGNYYLMNDIKECNHNVETMLFDLCSGDVSYCDGVASHGEVFAEIQFGEGIVTEGVVYFAFVSCA